MVLTSGVPLPACFVYVGKHGYLSDENGQVPAYTGRGCLLFQRGGRAP
ncbi:hypothetical protein GCM10009555_104960 [Acrocarpospora macrocephala]|uniref:Uncharacterized protein n=1 Tax=Acrocarpospora macrocephala TaxID=150177 RepID=A0A5M3WVL6_9ACTN|nr:hypothetical protein Amac_063470 [Acrocarpospora macrocephala]